MAFRWAARLGLPLLAAGLFAFPGPAPAQTAPLPRGADKAPESIRPFLGAWDLELAGQPRQCTLMLAPDTAAQGWQVRFPATCRRALAVLDQISSWNLGPRGAPRLNDATGKPVIAFEDAGAGKPLRGKGPDGQDYRLDSKAYPRAVARPAMRSAEATATAAQRVTTVDPARAPAAEAMPGRYSVMRQANREACKLDLSAGPASVPGNARATLETGCQDTGLTIFDPAGWRYASGRLTLVARKGHSVDLVFENGQWRKDPAIGAPLLLRKLAP